MSHRSSVVLAAALAATAFAATAQPEKGPAAKGAAAKPAAAAPPKTVDAVTVTGASQNGYRSSIDRRSYGVANDLATTTGAISDALKNIPSVEVDVNGNVSLRGETNVTILIDGKPSGLFKGASAAQALQAMPADSIERVEVITNPSAAFSPEGSAGVINLITKQTRKPGKSGSFRLNVGTGERGNVGVTASYNSSKLTLTADINARKDPNSGHGGDMRSVLDGQGHTLSTTTSTFDQNSDQSQNSGRISADYDLDAKTRISGELRHFHFDVDAHQHVPVTSFGPTGAVTMAADERLTQKLGHDTDAAQASYRHKFGEDHELVINASRERTTEDRTTRFDEMFTVPVAPDFYSDLHSSQTLTLTQVKADYSRPMPAESKLKSGYDFRIDDNDYDNIGLRGTSAANAGPDPSQTNLFRYRQTINAGYATYERPFGDWTVLGGVRLEEVALDLNQVTSSLAQSRDYFRAYPSLHVAYRFADDQQLILSYSKRVQRPNPQDLNAFRVQRDPLNFSAGNPNLKPQFTDSFEAGYQYKAASTFYLGTLFYRHSQNGVTDVVTSLGDGVLLNTKENLGESQTAGLELVANGRLGKTLTYNVSSSLYWQEVDASGQGFAQAPGFAGRRSAFAQGGRASLNWQATPRDQLQFSGQLNAKRLTPQGYNDPNFLTFMGYRHKFNDSLSLVATAQDVLGTFKFRNVIDTPTLRDRSFGYPKIQAILIGLNWNFGTPSKRPRDQGFDFGGAGPTP